MSKFSQDKNMIAAYNEGKDLYATIATGVYHNKYEDNLELYPDGTLNPDGKARRSSCKGLLLGIMYSRGAASIAEQIGGTVEDAQKIINNFYKSFPNVEKFVAASEKMARDKGYVEDLWGRRRRLPDILLPRFTITHKSSKGVSGDFNPFIGCKNREVVDKIIQSYKEQLENAKSKKQIDLIKKKAEIDGINIVNNGGFISQAQRQCVNARIQGSAATMTKLAMVKIHNDKELKDLGFRLLIGVHDELIGECPVENQEQAAKLLTRDMATCVGDNFGVPFKCDADLSFNWYWSDYCAKVRQEFLNIKDKEQEEAFKIICENHTELTEENLREVIFRDFKNESDSDWQKRFERMQDKEEFNYLTD